MILKNGARVLFATRDQVLAEIENGAFAKFAVWTLNDDGSTHHGDYFSSEDPKYRMGLAAFMAACNRFVERMSSEERGVLRETLKRW